MAARMNTQGESGAIASSTHETGAASSRRFSLLAMSARTIGRNGQSANFWRSSSSAPGSRSKNASRLRSSARRS